MVEGSHCLANTVALLQVQDVECFRENIETEQSRVTLTVVSDDHNGRPVYYDVMVCVQFLILPQDLLFHAAPVTLPVY